MRNKIDLARKVVKPTPVVNKNKRPVYQYQEYEPTPEELADAGYNDIDEYNRQQQAAEDYQQKTRIEDNLRRISELKEKIAGKAKISSKEKFLIILKNPIVIKIIIILFIIILVIIIIAIIVSAISGGGISDHTVLIEQCPTITVTYTGCDSNGENCNHKYDGEVSFEDYIAGVLAAEEPYYLEAIRLRIEELVDMGVIKEIDKEKEFEKMAIEYYKLQAIIVRTNTLSQMTFNCEVEGNSNFQNYIDVNDSERSGLIKQAVEANKGEILTETVDEDEFLLYGNYSSACVVNADSSYYYIRYGRMTHKEPQIQKIPKDWASKYGIDNALHNLYYNTPKSDIVYEQPACPKGTNDYGMTKIGTLYLFIEEYETEDILNYYFEEENIEVQAIEIQTSEEVNGFTNPTNTVYCTSPFGSRTHPVTGKTSYHSGIDIAIAGGSPVYASKPGKITDVAKNVTAINSYCGVSSNLSYGNYVVIQHDDGTSTLYAHMKYGSIPSSISVGKRIEQGTQIGQVGSTGCSTGNHLHYEVRKNGTRVDPADYLDLSNATGSCRR